MDAVALSRSCSLWVTAALTAKHLSEGAATRRRPRHLAAVKACPQLLDFRLSHTVLEYAGIRDAKRSAEALPALSRAALARARSPAVARAQPERGEGLLVLLHQRLHVMPYWACTTAHFARTGHSPVRHTSLAKSLDSVSRDAASSREVAQRASAS